MFLFFRGVNFLAADWVLWYNFFQGLKNLSVKKEKGFRATLNFLNKNGLKRARTTCVVINYI